MQIKTVFVKCGASLGPGAWSLNLQHLITLGNQTIFNVLEIRQSF